MKVAILSDLHLGYGWGTERQEDSFVQAREALEKATANGAEMILIAGDIFDSRSPKQEILKEAMAVFSSIKTASEPKLKLVQISNANDKEEAAVSFYDVHKIGVPIVAISGTHERRGKGFVNPVKLLEEAGFLIQLDGQTAIFEQASDLSPDTRKAEKIAICGVSGVAEIHARARLKELKPKPAPRATNILMIHQSLQDFVYMDDDSPTLTLKDLPKGFDLIVNGHVHWNAQAQIGITDLLIAGSTITTQVRKSESAIPKKIFFYDTEKKTIQALELATPRKIFYHEIDCSDLDGTQIRKKVGALLEQIKKQRFDKKPLVRVKLVGDVSSMVENTIGNFSDITDEHKDKLILTIKNETRCKEKAEKIAAARNLLEEKISIEQRGANLLTKRVQEESLALPADLFELLAAGEVEKAEALLLEEQKKPEEKQEIKKERTEKAEAVEEKRPVQVTPITKKGQQQLF